MALNSQHIKLAKSLPPRLIRFFARYPPPSIQQPHPQLPQDSISTAPTTPSDPNTTISDINIPPEPYQNPFASQRHPITQKWHNPIFSLRRQADLVKLARNHGVEELLPFTVKGTQERLRRREENGLRVKGTGVGQKVKGKGWERTLKGRLAKRKKAMIEMPKLVQHWKERGHGRGIKKWPK
ncbi:MAG: hypothetical protein M1835_005194 [Candelina submexicana]|nr:MAG: hypothetical protein M1835_005194 [Candelina submexicana]